MNAAQERRRAERQRTAVREMTTGGGDAAAPPGEPQPAPAPFEDVVTEARAAVLNALGVSDGPGIPIQCLCFTDRTFQLCGMQSGDKIHANRQANGREHRIELVAGVNAFLVAFLDPTLRKVEFEFVERSAVKTWRVARA